jgi:hypothetical protein
MMLIIFGVRCMLQIRNLHCEETEQKARLVLDCSTGPAAVIRNLSHVLTDADMDSGFRVVTIDRYYTGVPLLLTLDLKMYAIGTI